jgi:hypothetical protein
LRVVEKAESASSDANKLVGTKAIGEGAHLRMRTPSWGSVID